MSKISGIRIGTNPSESFQIPAGQLGGRDQSVVLQTPTANVNRRNVDEVAKSIKENHKNTKTALKKLEVLGGLLVPDKETDLVTLDKTFVDDFKDCVKTLKKEIDKMFKTASQ